MTNSKEMKCSIELCGSPFILHYFKPSSFKNMNTGIISKIKLTAHLLYSLYVNSDKSDILSNSLIDYITGKTEEILELSRRSGCRILILNAPFNTIGIFMFGKRFSMIDSLFGGKSDGFYSIIFSNMQKLAKDCEHKMIRGAGEKDV